MRAHHFRTHRKATRVRAARLWIRKFAQVTDPEGALLVAALCQAAKDLNPVGVDVAARDAEDVALVARVAEWFLGAQCAGWCALVGLDHEALIEAMDHLGLLGSSFPAAQTN